MSAHTPGPWKVFGIKSRHGDYTISTFNAYGPQRHIAYAAWASDQGLADAHMIAAAPDLLEALKKLSFAAQTSGGTAGRDEALVAAIDHASAIIAKATGAPQ